MRRWSLSEQEQVKFRKELANKAMTMLAEALLGAQVNETEASSRPLT